MALRDSDETNPYHRLNEIASRRPGEAFHPPDIDRETLVDICDAIRDDFDSIFDDFADGTVLSRREAQVYALKKAVLTPERLTDNAIGVLLGVLEGREKPITQQSINRTVQSAEDKIEQARETMWAKTATPAEADLVHPQITWLEHRTLQELRSRASDDDRTIDDVVSRLLDETQASIPLREVLESLVADKDIADVQVSKDFLTEGHTLQMTVTMPAHQRSDSGTPEILEPYDRITVDGQEFRFDVQESSMGPGGMANAVTLYASDNIRRMDPVPIDDGLASLRAFLDDDQDEEQEQGEEQEVDE